MTDQLHTCVVCPPGKPSKTEGGQLVCFHCSNRILRWLRELEDYLPTLTVTRTATGITDRGKPGFASQSPADDNVLHHTDWRTGWDALDGLGAVATIHSWARAVREDRAFQPPTYISLTSEVEALRTNHQWLICQPFVDEYARELREIHVAVRAAANDPVPRSVGRCITLGSRGECGGKVYERPDLEAVQCATCHRIYSGLELLRLRVAQEETA